MDKLKPTRTKAFDHTTRGLLTKRRELHADAEALQAQLAELRNDVLAIDRALYVLGYDKDNHAA